MITKNDTRVINVDGAIAEFRSSEENKERYLENIFSDYPDVKKPFDLKDLYKRSRRDKAIVLQCPKKITLSEALKLGKLKMYTLTEKQEINVWQCILNKYCVGWSYTSDSPGKILQSIKDKWISVGEPEDVNEFSFLEKWFRSINLESKVNKYYFIRINPVKYIIKHRCYPIPGDFFCVFQSGQENCFDVYLSDESPHKDTISKDVKIFVLRELFLAKFEYHKTCTRIYQHICNARNCVKVCKYAVYAQDLSHERKKLLDRAKNNSELYLKKIHSLLSSISSYSAPVRVNKNQLEASVAIMCADFLSHEIKIHYDRYADASEGIDFNKIKSMIKSGKCTLSFPYLKNSSMANWIKYVLFLQQVKPKVGICGIDKEMFDMAMRYIYSLISFHVFQRNYRSYKEFYDNFKGFGETLMKELKDNGYEFYDYNYAKNYVENIFQLYVLILVYYAGEYASPMGNLISDYSLDVFRSMRTNSLHNIPYYVDYKTKKQYINPNRAKTINNNHIDILSYGGMYNFDELTPLEAKSFQALRTAFSSTHISSLERAKFRTIQQLFINGFVPIFDGTKLSIFDLVHFEEMQCIVDLLKEVI